MTELDQPIAVPRRRFRFGLSTLLVVVTLAAVGSWGYWIGWPRLLVYLEQSRFERAAVQIKTGMIRAQASRLLFPYAHSTVATNNERGKRIALSQIDLKSATYFVFYRYSDEYQGGLDDRAPAASVEVFRLPPVPEGYQPRTPHQIENLVRRGGDTGMQVDAGNYYFNDFMNVISGDRKNNYGFQYELIYSDPPAKDKPQ